MSLPGRFVSTAAGRVFVHRSGQGAPLVLLHGWMMSHWYFRPLIDGLGGAREIIAIDLPGFGESDRPSPSAFAYDLSAFADVVDGVLQSLDLDSADVIGHSMGGGTAMTLAARHPERVQRLVLVAPAVYPLPLLPWQARLGLTAVVGPLLFKHVYSRRDFARGCREWSVRQGRLLDDDWIDYFWARLNRAGGRESTYACLRMLTSLAAHNADPGRVRAPTLIVWGDEDRLVPLAHGRRLQRAVAGARLEIVPASGHTPFLERPAEFLRLLTPFLAAPASPLLATPIPPRRAHSVVTS